MAYLFLATVVLAVCAVNAEPEFYRDVNGGKCEDLVNARTPLEGQQVAPGDWYIPYGTLEGKCVGAYALIRPAESKGWGDIRVIENGKQDYTYFPNDVLFDNATATNQVTTIPGGAFAVVVAQDEEKYCFWAQCVKEGDKSKLGIFFGVRDQTTNLELRKAFDDGLAALEKVGLKPQQTFETPVEGCPRYRTIRF